MGRELREAVTGIVNEPILKVIPVNKDLEKVRWEEEDFKRRYEEEGPWTKVSTKTVVRPNSQRSLISELTPIVESEEMEIGAGEDKMDSDEGNDMLEIHLPLRDLEI